MKIPNLDKTVVPEAKVSEYLLSLAHPDGGGKAEFFIQFGFSSAAWKVLAQALLRHATDHEIAKTEDSPYGLRYVVEGVLYAPDGRTPDVRSVLIRGSWQRRPAIRNRLPVARKKTMINELDRVVLTADLPEHGLLSGDIGTVVLIHRGGAGFEVEFVTLDGETLAVTSLSASQVRPISHKEIARAHAGVRLIRTLKVFTVLAGRRVWRIKPMSVIELPVALTCRTAAAVFSFGDIVPVVLSPDA